MILRPGIIPTGIILIDPYLKERTKSRIMRRMPLFAWSNVPATTLSGFLLGTFDFVSEMSLNLFSLILENP